MSPGSDLTLSIVRGWFARAIGFEQKWQQTQAPDVKAKGS